MNFQSFNLDLKDTNDLVFFNSSEREFHILGPIKEKVSIPDFTFLTWGTNITFFFSVLTSFSLSVILQCDLVLYLELDYCIKSQMKGGESLFLILNISVARQRKFF